jgi:branched-chain amino acid transport system permease protein
MNTQIAILLAQDGLVNGAIYALLALALVLVFAVARVIFIPQGEFVAFGALTLATLQLGRIPGTVWLALMLAVLAFAIEAVALLRTSTGIAVIARLARAALSYLLLPALLAGAVAWAAARQFPFAVQVVLSTALVTCMGPLLYRIAYQPLVDASVLVLLIVSVAVHLALTGLGLYFFGAEGSRTPAFSEHAVRLGSLSISGQSQWVLLSSVALIGLLYLFFDRTIYGKALRATAVNRIGARLSGISAVLAGRLSFLLAALIGAFSGILIAPITTIYYDSGFLVGLKGFVGAIIGGLASYPIAAAGALLVGLLESYSSFWASAYKEVIVFTLIIPVLLVRSLTARHHEEES